MILTCLRCLFLVMTVSTVGPKRGSVRGKPHYSIFILPFEETTFYGFFWLVFLHFTPVEEKTWEDRAPGLCLKEFAGTEMAGAQGPELGQTGGSQKMKDCYLLN